MTLPDDARAELCRTQIEFAVLRLPEYARQRLSDDWASQLAILLIEDIDEAERYVAEIQADLPSVVRRTTWRDPATQRALRTALTVIITPLLAAVLAALAGRLSVIIQAGGIPADLQADAVGHATWLTQRVWEACMPALLIALAAAVWVNPARHRLILCGGLATALAITGWSCGFGVPLWALVPSAALAIGRALTTAPR